MLCVPLVDAWVCRVRVQLLGVACSFHVFESLISSSAAEYLQKGKVMGYRDIILDHLRLHIHYLSIFHAPPYSTFSPSLLSSGLRRP
jgi:hypothetical protein